jgi:hypothetical protein
MALIDYVLHQVTEPFVLVDDEDVVAVKVHEGKLIEKLDSKPEQIALQFTCLKAGSTEVTVGFKFPDMPDVKVIWSFKKSCSQLQMFEGVAVPGLDVGELPVCSAYPLRHVAAHADTATLHRMRLHILFIIIITTTTPTTHHHHHQSIMTS